MAAVIEAGEQELRHSLLYGCWRPKTSSVRLLPPQGAELEVEQLGLEELSHGMQTLQTEV